MPQSLIFIGAPSPRRNSFRKQLALFAVILQLCHFTLHAQLTRGGLTGTVTDPSGARVRAAKVRIVEIHTNAQRETSTNEVGIYRFSALQPGTYDAQIQAHGFKEHQIKNLQIGASREITLNQALSIEAEVTSIQVHSDSMASQSSDVAVENAVYLDHETLELAPFLNTLRDPHLAAVFLPTVSRAPGFSGFSAGGQRSRNQNFVLDGVDNNDLSVTGSTLRLIPEEIAELQIRFPVVSAEFGQTTGTQVSVITMSGTNSLHGNAWNYFRSNKLEPLALADERAGFRVSPRFARNQTGGSLGGPVRKNQTFFYAAIESTRRREAASTRSASSVTIPTLNGFAQLADLPLGDGQSVSSRQRVLKAISFLPNIYEHLGNPSSTVLRPVNGVPIEFQTQRIPVAAPSDLWHGLFRLDHSMAVAGSLSYRLLFDKRSQQNSASNLQFADRFAASSEILNQSHTTSFSYAFSPLWMTENRFAYTRSNLDFPENDPTSPTVQILGAFTFGGLSSFPQGRVANLFQWQHQSSRSAGIHLIKVGADMRRNRLFNLAAFDRKGTWTFNNISDYLNSQPSRIRGLLTDSSYDARQTNQSYFVQDNVRLKENLSLNLGLRYELNGVPMGYFGTEDPFLRALGVPGPARRDTNNIAPRLGFAFVPAVRSAWLRRLFGESATTVRVGYSMNYDVIFFNVLTVAASNYPRALKYDLFAPDTFELFPQSLQSPTQLPIFDPLRFPFANTPEDLQNPTSHNWMISIRRDLGLRQTLEIGYLGNRSYHLLRQSERNPGRLSPEQAETVKRGLAIASVQERRLNPARASRAIVESTAISKYHGAYLRHSQRFIRGLRSEVNFTWSGTFSDNDEPLAVGDIVLSSPQVPQNLSDYRTEWSRSVFDRPLRVSALFDYSLPKPNLAAAKLPFSNQLLAGWSLSGSAEWQSGQPFTIVTGVDSGGSGIAAGWRPDLLSGGSLAADPSSNDLRTFSTREKFKTPRTTNGSPLANSMPEGGNLGRNTYRGPAFTIWNLNIAKTVELHENVRLRLRGDFINAWNHRNFGNPVANMNSAAFGSNTTDPGNRAVLLSAKLSF
ncbi:MAG TPA: TonB-dependent receptor [Candidatus Saccharimonadales bacterium]|nr:TonB-dependent receptor [Candidatus Saccharimonadales bacterium]